MTCNWARGKRRGFSPGATVDVRFEIGRLRRPISPDWTCEMSDFAKLELISEFVKSDMWDHQFRQIGHLRRPISGRSQVSDIQVRCSIGETSDFIKNGKDKWNKGSLQSIGPLVRPLWRAAVSGAKAPRLPRAQASYESSPTCTPRLQQVHREYIKGEDNTLKRVSHVTPMNIYMAQSCPTFTCRRN